MSLHLRQDQTIVLSVVSHKQLAMVGCLLDDLKKYCPDLPLEVIVTINCPEEFSIDKTDFSFPVEIIVNKKPLGFGANHNQAYRQSTGKYFCVLNPDIRLTGDPFTAVAGCLEESGGGLAAPLVVGPDGKVEDSARRFPTPWTILKKLFAADRIIDYDIGLEPFSPDWLAGMFMLFPYGLFGEIGGFDERYFLYYEDVDICARLRLAGRKIYLCPAATVIHDARRRSHGDMRHLRWHLASLFRFFCSPVFFKVLLGRRS